jgi:hypothetical protein
MTRTITILAMLAMVGMVGSCGDGSSVPGSDDPALSPAESQFIQAWDAAVGDVGVFMGYPNITARRLIGLGRLSCQLTESEYERIPVLPISRLWLRGTWQVARGYQWFGDGVPPIVIPLCDDPSPSVTDDDVVSELAGLVDL